MDSQTLTRKELYDLVWSTPFTSLAKKYAISDVGLRKICIKMEIPLPKSGHWEKVRFNKPVEIIKLSYTYKGENEVTLGLRAEGEVSDINLQSPLAVLENEVLKEGEALIVPEKLTKPDPLIISAREQLTAKRQYGNGGMTNTYGDEISIRVSPQFVSRALRFMDTFIKIMRKRGHEILLKNRLTYVVIYKEEIEINFREKMKRIPVESNLSWQQYDKVPTGILTFNAKIKWNNVEWKDGKLPLENQLAKIIAKLELKGEELRKETIEIKKYWAKQEEIQRIEKEKENRKKLEAANFKRMLQDSKRWQEVETLRKYLNDTEEKAKINNTLTDELKDWLQWGRKKADWYDPQINASDNLLNNSDKEILSNSK